MKATALIEQQHREVEGLFEKIEASKANARLLEQLASALTAHAIIEEQIFYPAAMKMKKDLVLESYEEHELMAFALKRLIATEPRDESFPARVKAVKEIVEQHVQEEEQELLPSAAEGLSEEEDETLGRQMEARFKELVALGYEGALAARKGRRATNGHRAKAAGTAKSPGTAKATTTSKKKTTSHAHRRAA